MVRRNNILGLVFGACATVFAASTVSQATAPVAIPACPLACASGQLAGCDSGWHSSDSESTDKRYKTGDGDHPLSCKEGSCADAHGLCNEEELFSPVDLVAFAQAAVSAADQASLEGLLANPERASLNVERGALQIFGCGGRIVGHISLPRKMVAALADELHGLN